MKKLDRRTAGRGANALRRARLAARLTQAQLAAAIGGGGGPAAICRMERGQQPIGRRRATRLALALGVAVEELTA